MESRIKLIKWLSLLLLSAGISGGPGFMPRFRWFRRPVDPDHHHKRKKLKDIDRKKQMAKTTKIRLETLRWLSLLELSVCLGGRSDRLLYFSLFRRP
jgi:hypothetical protein